MHFALLVGFPLVVYNSIAANRVANLFQPIQSSGVNGSPSIPPIERVPPPDGPPEFSTAIFEGSRTLRRNATILSILNWIGSLAQEDWTGQMPETISQYRDPQYPSMVIAVKSTGSGRIERRFVLWGLAGLANHMVRNNRFRVYQTQLKWQGSVVGTVRFIDLSTSASQQDFDEYNGTSASPTIDQTNGTTTPLRDGGLSWDFGFYNDELRQSDIYMGTIASLVQAAQRGNHDLGFFIGSWPRSVYKAIHFWVPIGTPSGLSKFILIRSMLATITEALAQKDFREVKVLVKQNGREIAQGGYADMHGFKENADSS